MPVKTILSSKIDLEPLGILKLSKDWKQTKIFYWTRIDKDSSWLELTPNDTLVYSNYRQTIQFEKEFSPILSIIKSIDYDPKSQRKVAETDFYTYFIHKDIKSPLRYSYDFLTGKYLAFYLDTVATKQKIACNKLEADSIAKEAIKAGLKLCGTAYLDLLNKDISLLKTPQRIARDSALEIISQMKTL